MVSKRRSISLIAALALLAGACGSDSASDGAAESTDETTAEETTTEETTDEAEASDEEAESSDEAAPSSDLTIGIVLPSSKTDGSFSQEGYTGLIEGAEAAGVETVFLDNVAVPDAVEAMANLAAEGTDVVIALGGQFGQAGIDVAPQFPDTHFIVMNGFGTADNLSSYSLSEGEVAYLGGLLTAATLTDMDSTARVAGLEITPLQFGSAGWILGARSVTPEMEYSSTFTGDFDDTAAALEATKAAFQSGADVVYTGMNNAIVGQEQAAEEEGGLLVFNAGDKCDDPDVGSLYYASTASDTAYAVAQVVTGVVDGSFAPGFDKKLVEDPNGFTLRLCGGDIPADVQALLDEAQAGLVSGDITVSLDVLGE